MPNTKLADYLFNRIKECGVDCTFGIPGDFVLPLYAAQAKAGMKTVVMTHEPSVGFAADAYARLKGLGVALVTYGAGGLNMVNPVGLAYAEESPVLIISGSPETRYRSQKPHLHHCVKTFDTQFNVYEQVTESQTLLSNPIIAQNEIERVLATTLSQSRPGYIEMPRDMVNVEIPLNDVHSRTQEETPAPALAEVVAEVIERLKNARRPVVLAGVEVRRFGLKDKVVALVQSLNLPVVTSILGKASFPESHPNFIGNYFGQFGNPKLKEYVEDSDLILSLGTVLTEMETAGYTAKLPQDHLIQATAKEVAVGYHTYAGVGLRSFVHELIDKVSRKVKPAMRFEIPSIPTEEFQTQKTKKLTVNGIIEDLNDMLNQNHSVVSDVGDCLYAGLSLKTDIFIAPGYYSSMGFGVPAGIGAQIAEPKRRSVILVGDGGFQMTGMDISTAVKEGLNPIVIVFNNASYAMLRFIDQDRDYYDLARWDYAGIAKAIGGRGSQATSREEFQRALNEANSSDSLYLIDAVIEKDDISPTLKRLTDHFGAKVKAAIG